MKNNTLKELELVINYHMQDRVEIKLHGVIDWTAPELRACSKYFLNTSAVEPTIIIPHQVKLEKPIDFIPIDWITL